MLVQQGLYKILYGKLAKLAGISDEDCEEMDLKMASTIQLYLTDKVIYNVIDKKNGYKIVIKIRNVLYDKESLQQVVSQETTI